MIGDGLDSSVPSGRGPVHARVGSLRRGGRPLPPQSRPERCDMDALLPRRLASTSRDGPLGTLGREAAQRHRVPAGPRRVRASSRIPLVPIRSEPTASPRPFLQSTRGRPGLDKGQRGQDKAARLGGVGSQRTKAEAVRALSCRNPKLRRWAKEVAVSTEPNDLEQLSRRLWGKPRTVSSRPAGRRTSVIGTEPSAVSAPSRWRTVGLD
ncbi:hypothetical protein DFJ74DRAFT_101845 [Hyaloraphidium curvatum]|nr:hypothetical protein DFJ74DRAFT_101845 [Hyaloraphidium curvatum]